MKEEFNSAVESIFKHKGFKCMIVRNTLTLTKGVMNKSQQKKYLKIFEKIKSNGFNESWWCGYIGVRPNHPLYKIKYKNVESVSAPGGLTFSNFGDGKVLPKNKTWWFGFDTMHFWDNDRYWTLSRIIKRVKMLAEEFQVRQLMFRNLKSE